MNIIEVKNNLVKLSYEEDIILGSFIKITDLKNSYIAQILHLESSRVGKTAIARLIFNFKAGIQAYDGSIPAIQAEVEILTNDFFVNLLDKNDPLILGNIPKSNTEVVISAKLLQDKPIICAEKSYQYKLLLDNLIKENEIAQRKTVVIDITGELESDNKIVATKDFKIPLNKNTINYIFDKEFNDLTDEYKAFVQDIFAELNEYIKTVEYIPFGDFNTVIDYEFKRTQQLQLIILKNKLKQLEKNNIFAQNETDFKILNNNLNNNNTIIIDLSKLNDELQSEYIIYIYNQLEKQNQNFYSIVTLNNNNSSRSILNTIFGLKNVLTSIVCPYSYKYIDFLKQCSKNMFMFTPIKQQNDFGAYNIFLNKLEEDEFILYGKSTKFVPLIIKLEEVNLKEYKNITNTTTKIEAQINEIPQETTKEEPIMEIPQEEINQQEIIEKQTVEDNQKQTTIIEEEPIMEIPQEEINQQEIIEKQTIEDNQEQVTIIEEEPTMEIPQEEINQQEIIEEQTVEANQEQIINESSIERLKEEQEMYQQVQDELSKISIDIDDDDIAEAITAGEKTVTINDLEDITDNNIDNEQNQKSLDPSDLFKNNENAELETEDITNLTDEDLDMIESLEANNQAKETENTESNEEISKENEVENETNTSSESNIQEEKQPSITDQILLEEAEKEAEQERIEANKPNPIEQQIEQPKVKNNDKLETKTAQTPIVPVYSAEIPEEDLVESDEIKQGDTIVHAEFGKGIVEKIINYGERNLCSVNFEQVGRRLLDPKISEMKKIN